MTDVPNTPRPAEPSAADDWMLAHVAQLLDSYHALTGRRVYEGPEHGSTLARAVYHADFVLLSHGTESDPLFNYANLAAQRLFEMPWAQFVLTPSRESAEPARQEARENVMRTVREKGYVDHYSGVRIAASGRRFTIEEATVWNVRSASGDLNGQAATFTAWRPL
jgi:hypothetical protein